MIRDPFYQDIISRLNGKLDPELFEQCAADLLRHIYPGLVPIRGGNDAGMDGAVGDTKGRAFPLVSTTQKNVIGNLDRNLKSYLHSGGTRRDVILATSQSLTPKKRQNLEKRASQLGFTLIQTHPQEAFADLLYRNPAWCKELLNLTGQPPALSIVPVSSRPQIVELLIGRTDDLSWLEHEHGDLILVGQPGSGKTFLMQTFAKQNQGLFLIDDDPARIASSVREQDPTVIIVDDAHLDANRLKKLRQLREEIGARFRIIATCWPGYKDNLLHLMQLPTSSMHELERLTRDQIVELIKSAGIAGPTELIRELVNQAEGRPGLAATLCYLCIKGDVREVAFGDALSKDIRTTFETLLGPDATPIIAAFSMGGDAGMPMETVVNQLGLTLIHVRQVVTGLAAGGVLTDVSEGKLSVRPPSLRHALVRNTFFSGPTSLPYGGLIEQSPDIVETTLTLIGARGCGAPIPDDLLTSLVSQTQSDRVWVSFSYLGSNECNWVLENHPDRVPAMAEAALSLVPQKAIPLLLSQAIGDDRPLHSNPDHSLRKIEDWVKSAEPGSDQATMRRKILLDSALSWFDESINANVTLKTIQFALSPAFAGNEMSPGSQLTVTFRSGLLTQAEMSTIHEFWPRIKEFLQAARINDWRPMFDIMSDWLYPSGVAKNVPKGILKSMREFAYLMAVDIIAMNSSHPGVLSRIVRVFEPFEMELAVNLDPEFDALFPAEGRGQETQARQAKAAESLAKSWLSLNAKEVARRMVLYELEARAADLTWPRWSTLVSERIASQVQDPSTWALAFIESSANSDLVIPFLQAAAANANPEYPELLKVCLSEPRLEFAGIAVGLTSSVLPQDLLPVIMAALNDGFDNWIEAVCMRLQVPDDRLAALLAHTNRSVAAAAAIGEYEAEPRGKVRGFIKDLWRAALIDGLERQYEGEEIFRKDPSIAFDWLQSRIKDKDKVLYLGDNLLKAALEVINPEQRRYLLQQIGDGYWYDAIIYGIVDNEPEVYRALIQNPGLKRYHLAPLAEKPTGLWVEKALLALDGGYSPSDIARVVYHSDQSWSGNESVHWDHWAESFDSLLAHGNPHIRTIGQIGKDIALAEKARAVAREKHEDIYGR